MRSKVWVVGYFFRNNLGDDIFEWLFTKILTEDGYEPVLINADSLSLPVPDDVKAIIVGGGDLINDYFLRKLKPLFDKRRCPIYAVGVGIPYPQMISDGALDQFDYIIHRTSTEHAQLVDRYGPHHVHCSPDLAWMLASSPPPAKKAKGTQHVAVCLARPMFNANAPGSYREIVNGIAEFLYELANETTPVRAICRPRREVPAYHLEFVPFQCDQLHTQDDRLIHQHVVERMILLNEGKPMANLTLHMDAPELNQVVPFFQRFSYAICSRFHAHVFALIAQVPILSIHCTHKVEALMIDARLQDYSYQLPVDPQYLYPLTCDPNELGKRSDLLLRNETQIRKHLANYADQAKQSMRATRLMLQNLLFYLPQPVTRFVKEPAARQVAQHLVFRGLESPYSSMVEADGEDELDMILRPGGLLEWGLKPADVERVAQMISMLVVGQPKSEYTWGLEQNMLKPDFDLRGACEWIFKHRLTEPGHRIQEFPRWKALNNVPEEQRVFDIEYVRSSSDVSGKHRSGWDFVTQHLQRHHRPGAMIFDSYLDETFGWRYQTLLDVGKIPFAQSWMGILHHTPNESQHNNLVRLFARDAWQESLVYCRGLVVLSESLACWVRNALHQLGFQIPVKVLLHPTEFDVPGWDWFKFCKSVDTKLIQVGGWMRNTFAIYDFPNYIKYYGYTKCALKGHGMGFYYLTDDEYAEFYERVDQAWEKYVLQNLLQPDTCPSNEQTGTGASSGKSPWIVGAKLASLEDLEVKYKSVRLIEHQPDACYDDLLTDNIVFLNLVDASAVNTVIECIVRATPILVNPLPAVVEYLGEDYPFYYTTLEEAARKLITPGKIYETHEYLRHKNKAHLKIDHFITTLLQFIERPETE